MPWMKAPYASTINSLSGHCISAEADEVVHVPEVVVPEAIARGWQDTAAPSYEDTQPEVTEPPSHEEADDQADQFQVELDQAVIRVLTRNTPSDFKNDGVPKLKPVIDEMSPDVKKPTAGDVAKSFERLQDNVNLAETD